MQRFETLQRIQHPTHADVVGHAAVHQMEVRSMDAVTESLHFLELPYRTCRGPRRVRGFDEELYPTGHGIVASAAIVVERDRREHDGHGRRCRGGTRQRHRIETRAENVERVLVEGKTGSGRDVGG